MKALRISSFFVLSLIVTAGVVWSQEAASGEDPSDGESTMALDLVRDALQAEVDGDSARRAAWLEEALRVDPECESARWQSGFVRIDGQWLSLDAAASKFRSDSTRAEYREVRESLQESPQKDLLLARWCQEKNMADEAQFHWLSVLRAQRDHAEALGALGVQWYNGLLLTPEQIEQQKRKDFQASRTSAPRSARMQRWESKIAQWEVAAKQGESNLLEKMEADLAADKQGNALVLANFLVGQRSQKPKDRAAWEVVSLNWIALLAKDPALTKFLVLHAVGNPAQPVRDAAIEELKRRPREEYVPLLLSCARFPVEFACNLLATSGLVNARYVLDVQGLEADAELDYTESVNITNDLASAPYIGAVAHMSPDGDLRIELPAQQRQVPLREVAPILFGSAALVRSQGMKNAVDQYNTASQEINHRVADVLARATGEDFDANPRSWQQWWSKYLVDTYELDWPKQDSSPSSQALPRDGQHGYVRDEHGYDVPERPVYRLSSTASALAQMTTLPLPFHSCFSGSTIVWTDTGPRPIETVLPGDRVLSQDSRSGKLDYKLVELVTKTAPAPMMKISVGGDEIISTLGHPFWVVGKRWRMAKQLEKGSLLHTVSGALPVEQLEELPAAKEWYAFAYNLQVADFHTYFVGQNQILVHHLTMLSVLDEGSTQVPGW